MNEDQKTIAISPLLVRMLEKELREGMALVTQDVFYSSDIQVRSLREKEHFTGATSVDELAEIILFEAFIRKHERTCSSLMRLVRQEKEKC